MGSLPSHHGLTGSQAFEAFLLNKVSMTILFNSAGIKPGASNPLSRSHCCQKCFLVAE